MKTTAKLFTIMLLVILCACNSNEKTNAPKVNFGIYETINVSEIPSSILDSLKTTQIQFEENLQQPTIGYMLKDDTLNIDAYENESLKLAKTISTVDKEGKSYAIAALKPTLAIDIADIQKTKVKDLYVEIHFNLGGANKWAEVTKKNVGRSVAFVINDRIYSMPFVNGEIRNGLAIITGLENDSIAKALSASLNASIPE